MLILPPYISVFTDKYELPKCHCRGTHKCNAALICYISRAKKNYIPEKQSCCLLSADICQIVNRLLYNINISPISHRMCVCFLGYSPK